MGKIETSFERREFKYLISQRKLDRITKTLDALLPRDPYCLDGKRYSILSLYLDTWDYQLYQANQRQTYDRFKARVRIYPDTPGPTFVEIKRRTGDVIRKERAVLKGEDWRAALRDQRFRNRSARDFSDRMERWGLRPTALVRYTRAAWSSPFEDYGRVSIDYDMGVRRPDGWSLSRDPLEFKPFDHQERVAGGEPAAVLELKFAGPPPRWMQSLVSSFELIRAGWSKYCGAVDTLAARPTERVSVWTR